MRLHRETDEACLEGTKIFLVYDFKLEFSCIRIDRHLQ
jgi:hypothetical protein